MTSHELDTLTTHYDTYFGQDDCTVLHPIVSDGLHIDALLYPPNDKLPYWKMATAGASDYKMPDTKSTLGRYNEYVIFIDPDEDMTDREVASWYYNKLLIIASFAHDNRTHVTYGHSFEWENADESDEMVGAYIALPEITGDSRFLYCKTGILKKVVCLQPVLLTRDDIDMLLNIGQSAFGSFIYPDSGRAHFICERKRSEKF